MVPWVRASNGQPRVEEVKRSRSREAEVLDLEAWRRLDPLSRVDEGTHFSERLS